MEFPKSLVEQLKTLAALGINQAIFNMLAVHEIRGGSPGGTRESL